MILTPFEEAKASRRLKGEIMRLILYKRLLMTVAAIGLSVGTAQADDIETGVFTVTEMGHGRFRAVDEEGTEFLLHLGRGVTRLEPEQWEIYVGDKVYVEFWPTYRGRPTPTCTLIRLEEPSARTRALTSPMEARIEEVGRTAVRVRKTVDGEVMTFTFARGRGTTFLPAGWSPRPGEMAEIHFTITPPRVPVPGLGHTLVAEKIEKQ